MTTARVVAPGPPTFELHTLGWRAFQDLCAAVIRTVWGQSAHAFADSNDAGRDGAFYGVWQDPLDERRLRDLPAGPFVLQCKHTKRHGTTLSESDLKEEYGKVSALVGGGLCRSYVLMTNARITGNAEARILSRLRREGVESPLVLDGQWICDTIAAHRELRLFVPRVYGLGDLSQILDERAYAQASVLMGAAKDQISTFVVTEPYLKAAQALHDHGFVLLLGEPAVGKSVIALMLAMAAADNWGCAPVKARTASELVAHWDPHEPCQFFWVDDAFGAFRHEDQLAQDWARSMPHVMGAISNGARVVLTSRTYVYREARPQLKEYAYPRLRESQVIVDVEDLTPDERRQIVYNHVQNGDQPATTRTGMKPFLGDAASAAPFRPEMARRLGLRAFTSGITLTKPGITEFMTHPRQFLRDVYEQLNPDQHAALALVYAAAPDSGLGNPLILDEAQRDIIDRAGSTPAGAARSLQSLTGDFLQATAPPFSKAGWAFRHPTLWEGFASWIATQSHLLTVVLDGLTDDALLRRADCEEENADEKPDTLMRIPPALYPHVAQRLAAIWQPFTGQKWTRKNGSTVATDAFQEHRSRQSAALSFLRHRSGDAFLRTCLDADPDLPDHLVQFTSNVRLVPEPGLLARLYKAGLLSEPVRLQAVERMAELAVLTPDSGWLDTDEWSILLTPGERASLMETVRRELVPQLLDVIDEDGGTPSYDPVRDSLEDYEKAFSAEGDHETAAEFAWAASRRNEELDGRPNGSYVPNRSRLAAANDVSSPGSARNIFDDIDGLQFLTVPMRPH